MPGLRCSPSSRPGWRVNIEYLGPARMAVSSPIWWRLACRWGRGRGRGRGCHRRSGRPLRPGARDRAAGRDIRTLARTAGTSSQAPATTADSAWNCSGCPACRARNRWSITSAVAPSSCVRKAVITSKASARASMARASHASKSGSAVAAGSSPAAGMSTSAMARSVPTSALVSWQEAANLGGTDSRDGDPPGVVVIMRSPSGLSRWPRRARRPAARARRWCTSGWLSHW